MEWFSVLPPMLAILVVVWRKEVISALFAGIFLAEFLLLSPGVGSVGMAWLNSLERIVGVFADSGNARLLVFSIMIGALLAFVRSSGGVTALVDLLVNKGIASTPRRTVLLTSAVGGAIFVEGNLSILTSGILSRGLFDKFKLGRARLAYIIDSTSAPVCILILLNGWGAFILALLNNYELSSASAVILWGSVPFNFYAIFTLLLVFYTAWTGKTYGPLRDSQDEIDVGQQVELEGKGTKARYLLAPMFVLIAGMVAFMYWTGNGDLAQGNGSKSVLYATATASLVAYIMMLVQGNHGHSELVKIGIKGMGELLPLVTILLFSLALGSSLNELGTGIFVAGIVGEFLPVILIAPMLFVTGALISFSTGTSWGTFAILIPLGVPLIQTLGLPPEFILAAILGGGVFGDHCSPISDTSAVSALASGCDLLEHVRTQLPYALFTGALTFVAYILVGLVIL
ncbi:MAG: Na+/H+ antiporter NhaC [Candidatus Azotimanducaceae bacterium]|jgi:Na+/H+ antiporter NhaC